MPSISRIAKPDFLRKQGAKGGFIEHGQPDETSNAGG